MQFEVIGAPSDIRVQSDDNPVMRAARATGGMAFECQPVVLHDAEHPLHVDRWPSNAAQMAVQQSPDPAIAVGRSLVDNGSDGKNEAGILGFPISSGCQHSACCFGSFPIPGISLALYAAQKSVLRAGLSSGSRRSV